jgi:hypothetical protein
MFFRFPETNGAAVEYSDQPPRGQKRGRIIKRKGGQRKDSGYEMPHRGYMENP